MPDLLERMALWWMNRARNKFEKIAERYPSIARAYVRDSEIFRRTVDSYENRLLEGDKKYQEAQTFLSEARKNYSDLQHQFNEIQDSRLALQKDLEERIFQLTSANEEIAALKNAVVKYDPVLVGSQRIDLNQKDNLIGLLKKGLANEKRRYDHFKANVRRQAHNYCVSANMKRKSDAVVVINHAGWITAMTPAAEEIFGDLKGKSYYCLIDGSDEDKEKIGEHLNGFEPVEGLLYIPSIKKKKKEVRQVAEVYVSPEFFDEQSLDGEKLIVRHSTVIEVKEVGIFGAVRMHLSGRKCLQDSLKDVLSNVKTDEQLRRETERLLADTQIALHRGGNPKSSP